ncbi:MAG: aldo/keto reductase [Thermotogaceae bacterium]|nr:aldo/keto reductase [Thermotogaceae bacterium]
MDYRKVGKWGLMLSELSLGSWLTFGNQLNLVDVKEIVHIAFDNGITFFDTAEAYNGGVAEYLFGQVLKDFNRMDYVVSTKIFWWGPRERNQHGLSKKHLIEGLYNSLKRLQLDYVDIVYCHRPDPETPLEEVVSAMDYILRQGMALYWGTSEWPVDKIRKAAELSRQIGILPPIVEQPQYNMFVRERVENEYLPAYEDPGIGLTTFSPLASGLLSGKYLNGIPEGSRLDRFPQVKKFVEEGGLLSKKTFEKIRKLRKVAEKVEATLPQLAIAWVLKNEFVTSVILGVSRKEQLVENLKAVEVKDRLTGDIMKEIESILKE